VRSVYFSFHYADIWKVNQVRNSGMLFGAKSVGFVDRSLWEEAKAKRDPALKRLIANALVGTSVTVVLIGRETAGRRWVKHEIRESIKRGNAILGLHINSAPGRDRRLAHRGRVPHALKAGGYPVYEWTNAKDFGEWVEAAWNDQKGEPDFLERWFG